MKKWRKKNIKITQNNVQEKKKKSSYDQEKLLLKERKKILLKECGRKEKNIIDADIVGNISLYPGEGERNYIIRLTIIFFLVPGLITLHPSALRETERMGNSKSEWVRESKNEWESGRVSWRSPPNKWQTANEGHQEPVTHTTITSAITTNTIITIWLSTPPHDHHHQPSELHPSHLLLPFFSFLPSLVIIYY